MSDNLLREHIEELASRKGGAHYLLQALDENPHADDKCFEALSQLVDRVTFHQISLGADVRSELSSFLRTQSSHLTAILSAWQAAFLAAEPSRYAMQLLLARYPSWIRDIPEEGSEAFRTILPAIAPHLGEVREDGVRTLISILNGCSSARNRGMLCESIVAYKGTSGATILAAARIADLCLKLDAPALAERMSVVMAPDELMETKEGRTLLPKIAALSMGGSSVDPATRMIAIELCFTVAERSFSSASYLVNKIQNLPEMPPDVRSAYLNAFDRIVSQVGISMVGYGSKALLELFLRGNVVDTVLFIDRGLALANRYGKVAAQNFFELKTAAARRAGQAGRLAMRAAG
jgi:hypothetical protein